MAISAPPGVSTVELDDFGLVRHRGRWVALSPHEEAVMQVLLARLGAVVSRQQLAEAVWPGRPGSHRPLTALICRLRRRLEAVGLTIRTVRARGFQLVVPPSELPTQGI